MAGKEYPRNNKYYVQQFYGIRNRERIGDGWWQDLNNMTADEYPVAKTRERRTTVKWKNGTAAAQAMLPGRPVSAATIDDKLYIGTSDGYVVGNGGCVKAPGTGHIAAFGNKIYTDGGALISEDLQTVDETALSIYGYAEYTLTDADSQEIQYQTGEKPQNPTDGMYWYDAGKNGLYRYSASQQEWVYVPVSYIKVKFKRHVFNEGTQDEEVVEIPDLSGYHAGEAVVMVGAAVDSAFIIHAVYDGDHELIFDGLIDVTPPSGQSVLEGPAEITRRCPKFDFIAEHGNRMWGCRYGANDRGEFVNEVYASELGKPLNWFLYEGTAADSWTASVGAPGAWTGMQEAGEYLYFFKENDIFVLSGSTPSTYRLTHVEDAGVQIGSEGSLVTIRGNVFYKSNVGVMRIGESAHPTKISDDLGKDIWSEAVAGSDGQKYFISMTDGSARRLYVYDTDTRLWTAEDAPGDVAIMVRHRSQLIAIRAEITTTAFDINYYYDEGKAQADKPIRADYQSAAAYAAALLLWQATIIKNKSWSGLASSLADAADADTIDELIAWLEDDASPHYATTKYLSWTEEYFYNAQYIILSGRRNIDVLTGQAYTFSAWTVTPTTLTAEGETEAPFGWYAETGKISLDWPNETRLRVLQVRAKTEGSFRVRIMYDDDGVWHELRAENKGHTGTYRIAFAPARRCDRFRLRYEGTGDAVLYSANMITEDAGDYVY